MFGFLCFLRNQTRMNIFHFLPVSTQMGFACSGGLFGFRETVWIPLFSREPNKDEHIPLSSLFYSNGVWFPGKRLDSSVFSGTKQGRTYSTSFHFLLKWGLLVVEVCLVAEKMFGFLCFLGNQTRMNIFHFLPFSIQMGFLFGFRENVWIPLFSREPNKDEHVPLSSLFYSNGVSVFSGKMFGFFCFLRNQTRTYSTFSWNLCLNFLRSQTPYDVVLMFVLLVEPEPRWGPNWLCSYVSSTCIWPSFP